MTRRKEPEIADATAPNVGEPPPGKARDAIAAAAPTVEEVAARVLAAMTMGTTLVPLIEWEFRYRTARMVETVRLRTYTEQEAEARAVAMKYLEELASPNVRFVYVRLSCVATTVKYPDLVARFKQDAAQLPKSLAPPLPSPPETLDVASRGLAPALPAPPAAEKAPNPEGFEEMDDGMSGPALPAEQVRSRAGRIGA